MREQGTNIYAERDIPRFTFMALPRDEWTGVNRNVCYLIKWRDALRGNTVSR